METQHLKQQEVQGLYKKMGYTWSMDQNDFILIAKAKDEIIGIMKDEQKKWISLKEECSLMMLKKGKTAAKSY